MEKNGLTAAEMDVVRAVFQQADDDTVASFLTPEDAQAVSDFRWAMSIGSKPYLMVSPVGLPDILQTVSGNRVILDYVFDLYGKFIARWASSDDAIHALHHNLARAFCVQYVGKSPTPAVCGTHKDLVERLSSKEDVVTLLDNTPWLSVILLQNIFPNVKIRVAKPNQRRATGQDQTA